MNDIKSAGGWFVGEYATLINEEFDILERDKVYRNEFVKKVYNGSGRDKDLNGTRTRVNAVRRIIRRRELIKALEYIIESERISKDDPKSIVNARQALKKIL